MKAVGKNKGSGHGKLIHFRHESESWMRLLEFIRAENYYIKTRIAEIASKDIGAKDLDRAEEFQNLSIRKDELIALARKDIREFDQWLELHGNERPDLSTEAVKRQERLRAEMETLEQKFNQFKFEFNKFAAENS